MVTIIFSLGKSDAKIRGIFETTKLFPGKVAYREKGSGETGRPKKPDSLRPKSQ